jgi:large subunit ribosomal protein L35
MPKMKTHRGAAKRFKLTGTGKIKRSKAYTGHLLTSKSPKRGRNLRSPAYISENDHAGVKKLLPYL